MVFRSWWMAVVLCLAASASAWGEEAKSVWDGVYSAPQAARGEAVYAAECSRCHREDLTGYNNALIGGPFMDRWREDTLESFAGGFDFRSAFVVPFQSGQNPLNAPGPGGSGVSRRGRVHPAKECVPGGQGRTDHRCVAAGARAGQTGSGGGARFFAGLRCGMPVAGGGRHVDGDSRDGTGADPESQRFECGGTESSWGAGAWHAPI